MRKEAASFSNREDIALPTNHYAVTSTIHETTDSMQLILTTASINKVALVAIVLHFADEGKVHHRDLSRIDRSVCYLIESLRPLVRKTDKVFLSGRSIIFMLLGANLEGGRIVQERLWDALLWQVHNIPEEETWHPQSITIGHSAFPEPSQNINQCIIEASKAKISFEASSTKATCKQIVQQNKDGELSALARKFGVPYLLLLPRKMPAKLQQLVSPKLAQELHCYPLGRERDILTVAMSNPQDNTVLDRLRRETGLHIFPVLANPRELQMVLEQFI